MSFDYAQDKLPNLFIRMTALALVPTRAYLSGRRRWRRPPGPAGYNW